MKKWKIAILLMANTAFLCAIFVVCLHEPRSKAQLVDDIYGDLSATLSAQESEIVSLALETVSNPTMITIERVKPAYNTKKETRRSLRSEDAVRLIKLINGGD